MLQTCKIWQLIQTATLKNERTQHWKKKKQVDCYQYRRNVRYSSHHRRNICRRTDKQSASQAESTETDPSEVVPKCLRNQDKHKGRIAALTARFIAQIRSTRFRCTTFYSRLQRLTVLRLSVCSSYTVRKQQR